MHIREITLKQLKPKAFIQSQVEAIRAQVGTGTAVVALSGGVDSSVVTALAHLALGSRLKAYVVDNGIMRAGEPQAVAGFFKKLGIRVELVNASAQFFKALRGVTDPEEKREAITQTFYKTVFGPLVKKSGGRFLLQGTIYTDVEETLAGIKRQHNVLAQLGIDTQRSYGYQVLEPVIQLRKPAVRLVGKALGLPKFVWERKPFPGPALTARVIGEATPARIATVRAATQVVEEELSSVRAFQYLAILHEDRVTGIRKGKREFGYQIEVRCWDSTDAVAGTPTRLPWPTLERLAGRITTEVKGVVSVTYNVTPKPPSTIEAV
jgi:GMP synthase (glutamine-hydrolysing)